MKLIRLKLPWTREAECRGNSHKWNSCGALLLIEESDVFRVDREASPRCKPYDDVFECSECGALNSLSSPGHPALPFVPPTRDPNPRGD